MRETADLLALCSSFVPTRCNIYKRTSFYEIHYC